MELFRKELDKKILEVSKNKIYEYLQKKNLKNIEFFKSNMDGVEGLYVENLKEQGGHKMVSRAADAERKSEIAVDTAFIIFDENGDPTGIDTNIQKYIESQLGHELLHTASRHNGRSGIVTTLDNKALNEGITQMLTEKIFDYNISSNTDSYRDNKRIAKILEATFGEQVIIDSYFNHTNDLKKQCTALSKDKYFYEKFNYELTFLQSIKCNGLKKDSYYANCATPVYEKMYNLLLQELCANIVVPHLQELKTPEEKNEYLFKILEASKDDEEISKQIKDIIIALGKMNFGQLHNEKCKIQKQLRKTKETKKLIDKIYRKQNLKSLVRVMDDGRISYLGDNLNVEVKNEKLKERILSELYFEENQYSKEDKEKFTEKVIKTCRDYETRTVFKFDEEETMIDRKELFSAIKVRARSLGYIICNSLSECENKQGIELDIVKVSKYQKPFSYEKLKEIYEKFEIEPNEQFTKFAKDKKTNRKEDDFYILRVAQFAKLWRESLKLNGTDKDIFSQENEELFNKISSLINESMTETGTIATREIYEKIPQDTVFNLFENPKNLKIIYDFYKRQNPYARMEVELAETSAEFVRGYNREAIRKIEAQEIVKQIDIKDINKKCISEGIRISEITRAYTQMQNHIQAQDAIYQGA